jgi:hypothetical protein
MRAGLAVLPLGAAIAVIAKLSLGSSVPLTYDEAWNFNELSSHGLRWVLSHYEVPNNHFLFTALQTVLPTRTIVAEPHLLRVLNCAVAAAALATITFVLRDAYRGWFTSAMLAVAVALCSPLFTLYLFVARGYLLAFVLAFLGVALAARRRYVASGVALGLAACAVPTFAFALPGTLVGIWVDAREQPRLKHAVRFVLPSLGLVMLTYVPHARAAASHLRAYNAGVTVQSFIATTTAWLGNRAYAALVLASALAVVLVVRRRGEVRTVAERTASFLLLGSASFFFVVAASAFAGVMNVPFPRNAMFVPPFLWVSALLLAPGAGRAADSCIRAIASLNGVIGALLLSVFLRVGADADEYPFFRELAGTASEALRAAGHDLPLSGVAFEEASWPVAKLYAESERIQAIEAKDVAAGPCAVGHIEARPGRRVWAVKSDGQMLLLCR